MWKGALELTIIKPKISTSSEKVLKGAYILLCQIFTQDLIIYVKNNHMYLKVYGFNAIINKR